MICLGACYFGIIDDIPYWCYEKFDLEELNDDQCKDTLGFLKNHIQDLKETLNIPEIMCYNVQVADVEGLCAVLKRFAYPCRCIDMIQIFARPVPQLSIICNQITNLIYENWNNLPSNLNQSWLSPQCLQGLQYHPSKGSCIKSPFCWWFLEGTLRSISRPNENQRIMGIMGLKNTRNKIKFQSVVAINGLVANLYENAVKAGC